MQTLRYSGLTRPEQDPWFKWLPVFLGLAVICGESTRTMGASHTGHWLQALVAHLHVEIDNIPETNHILRKSGHFLGYGTLGILFCRGWFALLVHRAKPIWAAARRVLRLRSAGIAIASVAAIASLDELHQSILPGRGASVYDVLLDTGGAVLLVTSYCLAITLIHYLRRRNLSTRVAEVRTLLQRNRHRERFLRTLESLERSRATSHR